VGSTDKMKFPRFVSSMKEVISISAGGHHAVALTVDGQV
jgi:alpha-tubulin suppressor-like RCC1 family protein